MVPSFEKYLLPFLRVMDCGKVMNIHEIAKLVATDMKLSDDDLNETLDSGQSRHLNRCSWAKTWFKKARLISSPSRARFVITPQGSALVAKNMEEITERYLVDNYPSFAEFSGKKPSKKDEPSKESAAAAVSTPVEQMEEAFRKIQAMTVDDVLQELKGQTPKFFEELVVKLLVSMGYGGDFEDAAEVTQYSADGGIDGIIKEDALGLDKVYVQAKRWSERTVGGPDIQQFIGALVNVGATKGIYISTSTFSEAARRQVRNSGSLKIVLIDGQELARLMIKHNVGVVVDRSFEVKRIDYGFFHPEEKV